MRQLLPPQLVALLVIAMGMASWLVPLAGPATGSARIVGLVVGSVTAAGGAALTLTGARRFDAIGTNIKTFDDPDVLVTAGPFRFTRNPMYLGFTLLLMGIALLVGTAVAAVGPVAFIAAADRWYIPFEEARMDERFGPDYAAYRRRVPRWIGAGR